MLPREITLIMNDIMSQEGHILEWEVFGNSQDDMRVILTWRKLCNKKVKERLIDKWNLRQSSFSSDNNEEDLSLKHQSQSKFFDSSGEFQHTYESQMDEEKLKRKKFKTVLATSSRQSSRQSSIEIDIVPRQSANQKHDGEDNDGGKNASVKTQLSSKAVNLAENLKGVELSLTVNSEDEREDSKRPSVKLIGKRKSLERGKSTDQDGDKVGSESPKIKVKVGKGIASGQRSFSIDTGNEEKGKSKEEDWRIKRSSKDESDKSRSPAERRKILGEGTKDEEELSPKKSSQEQSEQSRSSERSKISRRNTTDDEDMTESRKSTKKESEQSRSSERSKISRRNTTDDEDMTESRKSTKKESEQSRSSERNKISRRNTTDDEDMTESRKSTKKESEQSRSSERNKISRRNTTDDEDMTESRKSTKKESEQSRSSEKSKKLRKESKDDEDGTESKKSLNKENEQAGKGNDRQEEDFSSKKSLKGGKGRFGRKGTQDDEEESSRKTSNQERDQSASPVERSKFSRKGTKDGDEGGSKISSKDGDKSGDKGKSLNNIKKDEDLHEKKNSKGEEDNLQKKSSFEEIGKNDPNDPRKKKKNPFRKLRRDEKLGGVQKKGRLQLALSMDDGMLDSEPERGDNEEEVSVVEVSEIKTEKDAKKMLKLQRHKFQRSLDEDNGGNDGDLLVNQNNENGSRERKLSSQEILKKRRESLKMGVSGVEDGITINEDAILQTTEIVDKPIMELNENGSINQQVRRGRTSVLHNDPDFYRVQPLDKLPARIGWDTCVDCRYNGFCDNLKHKAEYMTIILQDYKYVQESEGGTEDCQCNVCLGGAVHNGCIYRELLRLKTVYRMFDKRNICLCSTCVPFRYRKMCLRQELKVLRTEGQDLYYRLTFHDDDGKEGYHPDLESYLLDFDEEFEAYDIDATATKIGNIEMELTDEDRKMFNNCIDCTFNGFCDNVGHKKLYLALLKEDAAKFEENKTDQCPCLVCEYNGAAHNGCARREVRRLKYDVLLFDRRNLCGCRECIPFKYRTICLRQEMRELKRQGILDLYSDL